MVLDAYTAVRNFSQGHALLGHNPGAYKKAIKRKHCVYRMLNEEEKLEVRHAPGTCVIQVKNDSTKMITDAKTNIILGLAKSFVTQMWA